MAAGPESFPNPTCEIVPEGAVGRISVCPKLNISGEGIRVPELADTAVGRTNAVRCSPSTHSAIIRTHVTGRKRKDATIEKSEIPINCLVPGNY